MCECMSSSCECNTFGWRRVFQLPFYFAPFSNKTDNDEVLRCHKISIYIFVHFSLIWPVCWAVSVEQCVSFELIQMIGALVVCSCLCLHSATFCLPLAAAHNIYRIKWKDIQTVNVWKHAVYFQKYSLNGILNSHKMRAFEMRPL